MRQRAQRLARNPLPSLTVFLLAFSALGIAVAGLFATRPDGVADPLDLVQNAPAPFGSLASEQSSDVVVGPDWVVDVPQESEEVLRERFLASLVWSWPAMGEISTPFGEEGPHWVGGYHQGIDIIADWGVDVRAAADGFVIEADDGWNRGYGTYVKIDHGYGVHTLYAHMAYLAVEAGQEIARGEIIGQVGNSGYSMGSHLHFEVRILGELRDPILFLP